jgi:hypothetical protein
MTMLTLLSSNNVPTISRSTDQSSSQADLAGKLRTFAASLPHGDLLAFSAEALAAAIERRLERGRFA